MSSSSARIWQAAGMALGIAGLIGAVVAWGLATTQSGTVGPALATAATTPSNPTSAPTSSTSTPTATATPTGPSDSQVQDALLTTADLRGKYQNQRTLLENFGDHEYNTHGACPAMDQIAAQIAAKRQSSVMGWPNAAVSFDYTPQTPSALLFESVNVVGTDQATLFMTETHQQAGCQKPFTTDSKQTFTMAALPTPKGTSDDCVAQAVTLLGPGGSKPPPQFIWVTARVGPVLITLESDTVENGETAPPIDAAMVSAAVSRVRGAGIGA